MIKIKSSVEKRHIIEEKAKILKAISHPVRLCIVSGLLSEPDCNVNKMTSCLDIPQSTISQHLAILKSAGIVEGQRNGLEVKYRVVNEDAIKVVNSMIQ